MFCHCQCILCLLKIWFSFYVMKRNDLLEFGEKVVQDQTGDFLQDDVPALAWDYAVFVSYPVRYSSSMISLMTFSYLLHW